MNAPADIDAGSVNVLWFLPTHGDGRYLGTAIGGRATNLTYLRQIAEAADRLDFLPACCCRPGRAARTLGSWLRRF